MDNCYKQEKIFLHEPLKYNTMDNRHAQAIPNNVINQVIQQLLEAKKLLEAYGTTLTVKQRKSLPKMSDKTIAFGEKSLQHGINHPEFLPGHISLEDWKIDMADVNSLKPVDVVLKDLCQMVSDTQMAAGNEASHAARAYYNSVKRAAADGVAGAQPIYNDLKPAFQNRANKTKTTDLK